MKKLIALFFVVLLTVTLAGCSKAYITVKVTNSTPGDLYQISVSANPSCLMCDDDSATIPLLTRGQTATVYLQPQTKHGDKVGVSACGRGSTTNCAKAEITMPVDEMAPLHADVNLSIGI